MKTKFLLLSMVLTIFSCGKTVEDHLANGLAEIEHTRVIGHTFKDNYTVDKMVFLKDEGQTYNLILKLSDDTTKDVGETYRMGIPVYCHQSEEE